MDEKSTLVLVKAWCLMAPSHYQNQCWPRSLLPYMASPGHSQYCGGHIFLCPCYMANCIMSIADKNSRLLLGCESGCGRHCGVLCQTGFGFQPFMYWIVLEKCLFAFNATPLHLNSDNSWNSTTKKTITCLYYVSILSHNNMGHMEPGHQ